jgi:hypothetical protein
MGPDNKPGGDMSNFSTDIFNRDFFLATNGTGVPMKFFD